jgi:hypothetical protein
VHGGEERAILVSVGVRETARIPWRQARRIEPLPVTRCPSSEELCMCPVEKSQDESKWLEKITGADLAGVQLPVYFCAKFAIYGGRDWCLVEPPARALL